jgi:hypothetical protein
MAGEAKRCCNTIQWAGLGDIVMGCLDSGPRIRFASLLAESIPDRLILVSI